MMPNGHIVISNDEVIEPLLGYGLNSIIDFKKIPPGLKFLLDEYKDEITAIKSQNIAVHESIKNKWDLYSSDEYGILKSYTLNTELLETSWGQGNTLGLSYNRFCPKDPSDTTKTCLVGCTAVALGQVLHFWGCRVFPDGTETYTPVGFSSSISLNLYDQDYNWDSMSHSSPDDDNAELLYHSAIAVSSDFGSSSTESSIYASRFALVNYFGFNANMPVEKDSLTSSVWLNMLKGEINAERPIIYRGAECDTCVGHQWVIDGYNSSDEFHCNWGWNGDEQSTYYTLTNLTPDVYNFNSTQKAILNIYPKLDGCSGDFSGEPLVCTSNESYSITLPSLASVVWSKSANLDQVGGNTGTTYTVNEGVSGTNAPGTITATIKDSQGSTFMTRTKTVWVGAPYINPNTIEFYNSEASTGKLCANAFGNDFSFTTSSEWSSFDIKLTNLAETQTICSFTIYDTQGDLDLCSVSDGTYMFWVRGTNDCGTASNWSKTSVEYEDCGGQFFLLMTPNPSSSQTTLSIVSTSTEKVDEAVEWELEVFDATQNLKEKKVKIKGTEIEINTGNWKEGVYLIRVNYNNEILQGKLVVKK